MDNLSFAPHRDHESASLIEDEADKPAGARQTTPIVPPAYRAVGVLDSHSAYAAVFGCSGGCGAPVG